MQRSEQVTRISCCTFGQQRNLFLTHAASFFRDGAR
jgi:hypothetical protein